MINNTIMEANKEGRKATVFALAHPALYMIEMASHVGFDAITIDGEHGGFPEEAIDDICRTANGYGMSVIARVPDSAAYQINLYLDRGIQGVTGPHINSGAEAQAFADACLFPTDGKRSWGGGRGTEFNDQTVLDDKYGGKLGFAKWSNANMLVVAQIEDKKAWDNLDAILAIPGLTGVTGGPHDFAQSLGHPGEPNHPDRIAATLDVETRARAAGKTAGGDQTSGIGIAELMLGEARAFVAAHKNDKLGS